MNDRVMKAAMMTVPGYAGPVKNGCDDNDAVEHSVTSKLVLINKLLAETNLLLGNTLAAIDGPSPESGDSSKHGNSGILSRLDDLISDARRASVQAQTLRERIGE